MADQKLEDLLKSSMPDVDFCSVRYHRDHVESLDVRQNILQPINRFSETGVMVTVHDRGGIGYAATADLSPGGLSAAFDIAREWAEATRGNTVIDYGAVDMPSPSGEYFSPVKKPWNATSTAEKIEALQELSQGLKTDPRIVDWSAAYSHKSEYRLYLTNQGGRSHQHFFYVMPGLSLTANKGTETVQRSLAGRHLIYQGGLEMLEKIDLQSRGAQLAEDALELLEAPNCPSGSMDVLLDSDQMILQIHESIGHPLELDRILGDERNFAGTSFVTLDMLGKYRYGSPVLNVSFDPTNSNQVASYHYDDDGTLAKKKYVIQEGILKRPLGGSISQQRAGGVDGVACSRASSWRRTAIDRMANLNLEPGESSFEDMVASIENGVFMRTNSSWSIDDSRNKFQFGCEYGRVIRNGELREVVKKPNYRGVSADFWRNLKMVGDSQSNQVLGTPYCGKGEPMQMAQVGHASPACVFSDVDVFGGG